MKKFKNLWYTGVSIVVIPTIMLLVVVFFALNEKTQQTTYPLEEIKQPKVDTVVVEKRVIVRDTVYIKPKIKPTPPTPVNDSL